MNQITILKKIGTAIIVTVCIAYIVMLAGYSICQVITEGDLQGIIMLTLAGVIGGISWHTARWRRWWVRFLRSFMPGETVRPADWGLREKYYWVYNYESNAQYGLRPADRIFEGRAKVWFEPSDIAADASRRLTAFKSLLESLGIKAKCTLDHIPGCIYADIIAETDYKTMNKTKLSAFREAFTRLDKMNYEGEYYVEYQGESGSILVECNHGGILRAVRTSPREEYHIDPDCGFYSDEAYYFFERYPDWTEGTYTLISGEAFYSRWEQRSFYHSKDEAFTVFDCSSLSYFAALTSGNKKEELHSSNDIRNAAAWLIANNETDMIRSLMNTREESMYWAAKLFHEIMPEEATETADRIINSCHDPVIVSLTKALRLT